MEQALDQIGSELGVSPEIIPTIRTLPKAQEVDELRIRIASLISENGRLETQVADRNRRAEAAEAQTLVTASQASAAEARAAVAEARAAAAEEARAFAESESTKWHGVSRKFFDSLGFPGDEGPDLWSMHEETGGSVGSEDPADACGLQRTSREFAEGDPVSIPTRRPRSWGRPIRAAPGPGSGAVTTGTTFPTHSNPRGATDRSTIRLNAATGGDTVSTRGCSNAQHSRPHPAGTDSGLSEHRWHSVIASVEHRRPSGVGNSSNRKSGADRSGHPDHSGFRSSQPAKETRIRPRKSVWRKPGWPRCRVSLPHEAVSRWAMGGDGRGAKDFRGRRRSDHWEPGRGSCRGSRGGTGSRELGGRGRRGSGRGRGRGGGRRPGLRQHRGRRRRFSANVLA